MHGYCIYYFIEGVQMKNFLAYATARIFLLFSLGCSQNAMEAQRSIASIIPENTFENVFEKSADLSEDESYSLDLRQQESSDYGITIGVGAVPPPPPPTPVPLNSDPLVIQIQPQSNLLLSNPANGVFFDIFGDNFRAGRRKVSWTIGYAFAFLALPDESNQIRNINQLFGDRTIGPDRKQAAHGFDALQKYDGYLGDGNYSLTQRNSVLDKDDAFFSKFRLWIDKNRDGQSSTDELQTLEEAGIISINLKFDPKYSERDQHGNIIAHKSFAKKLDGTSALVFDLWLRIDSAQ